MMVFLEQVNNLIWGVPVLLLIIATGADLSLRTGFAQLRLFTPACKALLHKMKTSEGNASFKALCTALAATVGTGNIAGVAGAIAVGGPGSIFWMWCCGFLGMMTKFSEALLAVRFRKISADGELLGGPMYVIENGLDKRWRPMATCYCLLGTCAAFGVGNAAQVNALVSGAETVIRYLSWKESRYVNLLLGLLIAAAATAVLAGGAKRIGNLAELLVPVAAATYLVLCVGALAARWQYIPKALGEIILGAFSPRAVTGGAIGSSIVALRIGAARGVFTNEAGMGTAGIAHGTADVKHPAEQGLMGIMEVFLDTIVICTMTALVILTSGTDIPYGLDEGAVLTIRAFSCTYGGWISIPITILIGTFAFATILGWGFYGRQCAGYLWGNRGLRHYISIMAIVSVGSAVMKTADVWIVAELLNGLMAIPNLLALAQLRKVVVCQTREFIRGEHLRSA